MRNNINLKEDSGRELPAGGMGERSRLSDAGLQDRGRYASRGRVRYDSECERWTQRQRENSGNPGAGITADHSHRGQKSFPSVFSASPSVIPSGPGDKFVDSVGSARPRS